MSGHLSPPEVPPKAERSAVLASQARACGVCGGVLEGRKRDACSDGCRAALSRRRRAQGREARDWEIRALLEAALRKLEESSTCPTLFLAGGSPAQMEDSMKPLARFAAMLTGLVLLLIITPSWGQTPGAP
jgi:hypothetical protein